MLDGLGRGRRVERHRGLGAEIVDAAQGAVQVAAGLGVHDDEAAAGLDPAGEQVVGLLHHEVGLEEQVGAIAAGGDHVGAEGEVRDEPAVHHVPLDAVDAGVGEVRDRVAEPGEVGGQDRRGDLEVRSVPGRADARSVIRPSSHGGSTVTVMPRRCSRRADDAIRWSACNCSRSPSTTWRPVATGSARARRPDGLRPRRRAGRRGRDRCRRGPATSGAWRHRVDRSPRATIGPQRRVRTWPTAAGAAAGSTSSPPPSVASRSASPRRRCDASAASGPPSTSAHRSLPSRHRTTVRCLVVDGRAAFRAEHSHDPVAVEHCLVAHPRIDELIADRTLRHRRRGHAAGRRRHR